MDYDFSGYATRNNVLCADGRVIMKDAFKDQDKKKVPLVYMHDHQFIDNVLGHCVLENRDDGVYVYGKFNSTPEGKHAKEAVKNGDVQALSIYANHLKQRGSNVVHGAIREVSLVLTGANPGAYIDTVLAHYDDDCEEAEIRFVDNDSCVILHADESDEIDDEEEKDTEEEDSEGMAEKTTSTDDSKETVDDVINTMTDKQKDVMYALIGMALEYNEDEEDTEVDEDSSDDTEGDDEMKHNIFEGDNKMNSMAHSEDFAEILRDGKRYGSLRESAHQHGYDEIYLNDVLQHDDYGIGNVDYLFPDYKNVTDQPGFVTRNMDWVSDVMGGVGHTPFSRIRTIFADITEDEARAKGYIKGKLKKEEFFSLIRRTTDPQTIYKKQKLDRDDVIDITDFDVVAWLKSEMRLKLDEEIARAILIGDGRLSSDEEKIAENHVRPIWTDEDFYTIKADVELDNGATEDDTARAVIRAAIKARKDYMGSGNPTFYTTEDMLTSMLLLTDADGRDLYLDEAQLARKLRVNKIVTVPYMENCTREGDGELSGKTLTLQGVVVNLADYNVGADKGGSVNMFDDFDIDYNQQKYLIETRCSGALIKPYSAIAVETYTE